jgi:methionyl-tRNA synthetase
MLMAAGIEPPTQVWAHGYLTVGGKKMSKTNLTGIHPFELLDHFGVDSYRYYWLRQIAWGADGDFSWESMVERHNADLANGLGNLASRVLAMLGSYVDGAVPAPGFVGADADLPSVTADAAARYDTHVLSVELHKAVAAVWSIVDRANGYLVEKEPWKLAKDPARREELESVLYASAETLRILAVLIQPIMPAAAQRLWEQLGLPGAVVDQRVPDATVWGQLPVGTATHKGDALFPRLELAEHS